jgi:hypothetical protein
VVRNTCTLRCMLTHTNRNLRDFVETTPQWRHNVSWGWVLEVAFPIGSYGEVTNSWRSPNRFVTQGGEGGGGRGTWEGGMAV